MICSIFLCFLVFSSCLMNMIYFSYINLTMIFLKFQSIFSFIVVFCNCCRTAGIILSPFYHRGKPGLAFLWPFSSRARNSSEYLFLSLSSPTRQPQAVLFLKVKQSPLCFLIFSNVPSIVRRIDSLYMLAEMEWGKWRFFQAGFNKTL